MKLKFFLIVSMMLAALISNGQQHGKKLKTKMTKEERAKMTPEQRIARSNERTMEKKKKDITVHDKVRSTKREGRKGRRLKKRS